MSTHHHIFILRIPARIPGQMSRRGGESGTLRLHWHWLRGTRKRHILPTVRITARITTTRRSATIIFPAVMP